MSRSVCPPNRADQRAGRARSRPVLAAVLAAGLLLGACSGGGVDPEEEGGGDGAAASTDGGDGGAPSQTDVFVHAADDEPTTMDPAQVEPGEGGETMILQVYERLLEVAPDGPDLVPALATEEPTDDNGLISEDGLTYTFPIREGVTFHDGTDLTADDVKYSWDRVMEMDLPESNAGLLSEIVEETTVVDDYTFEVTLQRPSAAFLNVGRRADGRVRGQRGRGRGQRRRRRRRAERVHAAEHGRHRPVHRSWSGTAARTSGSRSSPTTGVSRPTSTLRVDVVSDPDVRILGLRAGDYDTIETDPSLVPDLEGAEGVDHLQRGPAPRTDPASGSTSTSRTGPLPAEDTIPADFFHDPRIRQAFNYAFDYEAFLKGALGGFGDFDPHYCRSASSATTEDAPVYAEQDRGARRGAVPRGGCLGRGLHRLGRSPRRATCSRPRRWS